MKTMPCPAKRFPGLKEAWQKQKSKLTFVFFLRLWKHGIEPTEIHSRPG